MIDSIIQDLDKYKKIVVSAVENDVKNKSSTSKSYKNNNNISVKAVKKHEDNKRIYDKRFACLFCKKMICKLSRHIKQCHSDESLVQDLLNSTSPKDQQKISEFIRHLGNYKHNIQVLSEKDWRNSCC